jgi:abortive infection bacteriophage resistance protein
MDISVDNLLLYLPILANFRNLCAHEDILYDYKLKKLLMIQSIMKL